MAFRWILLLLLSLDSLFAVQALDLRVKNIKCQSRPIAIHFDYICNGDFVCTFGEMQSMEGAFIYYGLVDQFAATNADGILIDANMKVFLSGYTHETNLAEGLEMSLCPKLLKSDAYNQYGDCPNDGKYWFDTIYNMPDLISDSWAATGWNGEIELEMYLNTTMNLVGKCTMEVQTMVTGSYEAGVFRSPPSARTVTYTVFAAIMVAFGVCVYGCLKSRRRNYKDDALLEAEAEIEEPTTPYESASRADKTATYLM